MNAVDRHWMLEALTLARRGQGAVEPNPMVGAVVVRDGHCVGSGWHQRFGQPHAEVHALAEAGAAAHGATLYVTLEPCCHHGKTPPCTEAVVRAGIQRVVAAMSDPFPAVSGRGLSLLQAAGVAVEVGVCGAEARQLTAPYRKLLLTGRPWVHAKWAMTLDGKIATRTGHSQWISNETSRRHVHELRGRVDAIVCGIGTALADDPQLTARPPGPRTATRVVLDRRGRLPLDSHLVRTARTMPTLVVTSGPQPHLEAAGVEVMPLAEALPALLDEMGRRRWTNILLEGGAGVLGSFLDARLIDEFHVFVAPRLAGGQAALGAIGGQGIDRMEQALLLHEMTVEPLSGDWYLHGFTAEQA